MQHSQHSTRKIKSLFYVIFFKSSVNWNRGVNRWDGSRKAQPIRIKYGPIRWPDFGHVSNLHEMTTPPKLHNMLKCVECVNHREAVKESASLAPRKHARDLAPVTLPVTTSR